MELLSPAIEQAFELAGWHPGRCVAVTADVPQAHPAYEVLQQFGGLKVVPPTERGENCATSDVEFGTEPYSDKDIDAWQAILETKFVPIGEYHHGHGAVWLDGEGRLFESSLAGGPMVLLAGNNFAAGIENLLRGRRSQPMLLPWQNKVMVWGEWFEMGDPNVLTPGDFGSRR